MTVIARKGRNRIPLTGLLHTFPFLLLAIAAAAAGPEAPPASAAFGDEVPFVATPDHVTEAMLDIAAVKAGDHVVDLGSGDGRIVIAAARRGATGLGVDNSRMLVEESIANAKRAGVSSRARFLVQDLFATDLSLATVVTLYLLPEVNLQLRPALLALAPGTRIVSHDWDMGDWRPDRSLTIAVPDKEVGIEKSSRVHLWVVPARFGGLWCGARGKRGATLRLRQSHQVIEGRIEIDGVPAGPVSGAVAGSSAWIGRDGKRGELVLGWAGGKLRTLEARGALSAAKGFAWRPAGPAGTCRPG